MTVYNVRNVLNVLNVCNVKPERRKQDQSVITKR